MELTHNGIETYLRCPRRYEFASVYALDGSDDGPTDDRVDLLRRAICTALASGETDRDGLLETALSTLSSLWDDHDERFHSRAQRRHERQVLEATLRAYVDRVGLDHAGGIERTTSGSLPVDEIVGPSLPVSRTVTVPQSGEKRGVEPGPSNRVLAPESVTVEAEVDYVFRDGPSVVGVRFVPTLAPLGPLRYRSEWDGDVAERFTDHFDPAADVYDPAPVAALLETAVVLDGLRTLRDRLDLGGKTCRYVQVPLADRSKTSVNWVSESVETSLEIADLTDVYVDHHTYGLTHEHRNETVDSRLEAVVGRLVEGAFDPGDRWEQIRGEACPECAYAVCCEERIAAEVRFDG
ncbi:hypothetical protein EA473_01070 [Natrarchaeobius chitinivorans]|uniref:PD-(D/E)XK endonuclease-like domain-containing protein n=1 Tax=Natrarchaeobius chitinivorans TaxID=1679083 RepID=A0A3N6PII3_NATCH|nr:hypothetical protein [Natrarchaeobius chitinivorans]RQG98095.1 hypothetical protein EA473_01070 [Natrarchaeobius chitinivorans]